MRKIVAVLLAVLMLASALAMLPASAGDIYDGTTATTAGLHKLIITEIAQRTHEKNGLTPYASLPDERAQYADCAGYIEVFNNTDAAVNFDDLALLRALNFNEAITDPLDPMYPYFEAWVTEKKFLQKMTIDEGVIVKDPSLYELIFPTGDTTMGRILESLENSADDLTVASGKAAVIWFVNENTVNWLKAERAKNLAKYDPREVFVDRFYGPDANAADYNIIMVWAYKNEDLTDDTKLNKDMFTWEIPANSEYNKSVVIALADTGWDLDNDDCKGAVNEKIKSIVTIGNLVDGYVSAADNTAAVFAPANTKPLLQNKKNAVIGNNTEYTDYVAANLAMSYAEVGAIMWATAHTPGKITDWQYAMMADTVALPAGIDKTAVLNAFYIAEKLGDIEDGREETKKDHNYVDREELEALFSGANKDDGKGMKLWVILVIIGGAVLVLAAAAVVVFVVILPKKKAAAAVAAEEDAEGETAEEPAAEEAPAEETPAEEKTEE